MPREAGDLLSDGLWTYRAGIDRVVDGDTCIVRLDLGFHCYHVESLRLAGVDTPELFSGTNREAGKAAKEFVEQWVSYAYWDHGDNDTTWPFIVRTLKDKQTFNRYIGYVTRADTGEDLAEAIIAAGHGVRILV
jgi:micrococcal nuclease